MNIFSPTSKYYVRTMTINGKKTEIYNFNGKIYHKTLEKELPGGGKKWSLNIKEGR